MAAKRTNGGEDVSGRAKKKLKMSAARSIAVQSTSQPIASTSKVSSNTTGRTNARTGLPATIDVEKFVEARAFEINAMQNAMKTASAGSTHRVWQTLPRHLRRRAASHDVRRVPLRLRDRARAEMDVVRKKALGRSIPKRGKDKRISRSDSFLTRQRDKIWLETHIWHAKRMHMETLWGYRLAVRPTEKAFRPSHRASIHGAIIHDASYYVVIEAQGPEVLLKSMLDKVCDPQKAAPSSPRYVTGSRTVDIHIYKPGCYPYDLIGPATMMWRSVSAKHVPLEDAQRKGKDKEQEKDKASERTQALRVRSLWIRYHPAMNDEILYALKQAASQALADHKARNDVSEELKIELINRRGQMNVFEIMGPKSSQVLRGVLRHTSDNRKDFLQFWNALGELQSPGSMPRGMIVGCKVNDPRLSFPPRNFKSKGNASQSSPSGVVFPSAELAESDLWDEKIRANLATPRFKKKDLDERRANKEVPGTPLNSLRDDDRVPIILIQRSLETQNSGDNQGLHGWMLMIPAGWSMAFFSSLIYTGSRVAGQRERQTQAYEAGTPSFPRDYPLTSAYDDWATKRETEDRERWNRKPPAKRVNFDKLGVVHPWKANWNGVMGLGNQEQSGSDSTQPQFISTQREPEVANNGSVVTKNIRPWLLRGPEVSKILSNLYSVFNHSAALFSEINRLRLKRSLRPLVNETQSADLLQGALVNTKVTMCSRGTPEDLAMIYSLPDDMVLQWEKVLHSSKFSIDQETPQEMTLANTLPDDNAIIGYVTTGQYSLAKGKGYGLGAIGLTALLELVQQSMRRHSVRSAQPTIFVGVRNTDSRQCRAAYLEVLLSD